MLWCLCVCVCVSVLLSVRPSVCLSSVFCVSTFCSSIFIFMLVRSPSQVHVCEKFDRVAELTSVMSVRGVAAEIVLQKTQTVANTRFSGVFLPLRCFRTSLTPIRRILVYPGMLPYLVLVMASNHANRYLVPISFRSTIPWTFQEPKTPNFKEQKRDLKGI